MSKARDIADLLDSAGKVTADDLDVGAIGGRRNLIINGGFDVWQRGESTSNNKASWGYPTADRVRTSCASSSTTYQKVAADIGGKKSNALRVTFGGDENQFHVEQMLENSYNIISGNYVTFSYWIKCNNGTATVKTGSAGAYISNQDYDHKETVVGSEWVKVVLTSDRTSSAYDGANEMEFRFIDNSLSQGDASLAGLSFDIAQVQLELGSVATPFEHRSYGEELALCQRYYQYYPYLGECSPLGIVAGYTFTTNVYKWAVKTLAVPMRASPSVTLESGSGVKLDNKARYITTTSGQGGVDITPYSVGSVNEGWDGVSGDRNANNFTVIFMKNYNEHPANCYGFQAGFAADAEL